MSQPDSPNLLEQRFHMIMDLFIFYGGMGGPDENINKSFLFRQISNSFGRIRICLDESAICSVELGFVRPN